MKNKTDPKGMLEAALEYLSWEWVPIPLCPPTCSEELVPWHWKHGPCENPGKTPLVKWKRYQREPPTEADIRGWLQEYPWANLGIVTGAASGVDVPDFDSDEAIQEVQKLGTFPSCPQVRTGGDGIHAYFAHSEGHNLGNFVGKLGSINPALAKLDLRTTGGLVVVPPSLHVSGKRYIWAVPYKGKLPDLPSWFLELLHQADSSHGRQTEVAPGEHIPQGQRNDTLFRLGCAMRRRGATLASIEAALLQENTDRCDPALDESEVKRIARQATTYQPESGDGTPPTNAAATHESQTEPRGNLSDDGNALRLVRQYGKDVRYSYEIGRWYFWDGRRWRVDDLGRLEQLAKQTARSIHGESKSIADEKLAATTERWARASRNAGRIRSMLAMARSEPVVPVQVDEFDRNPWLFNVLNGTLNLQTGTLQPHRREDLITKLAPVEYAQGAPCPMWTSFLDHIMDSNPRLIGFLQRAVGYGLTGDVSEQALFFLYGTGANRGSIGTSTVPTIHSSSSTRQELVLCTQVN